MRRKRKQGGAGEADGRGAGGHAGARGLGFRVSKVHNEHIIRMMSSFGFPKYTTHNNQST